MARIHLIYNNPRYKVVEKDNKYLLIDLEQHWYSYLLPMLNWVIPIKYTELTYEELNSLYVIKNRYHSAYSLVIAGAGLLITRHV
ncbi:DUF443 family protein [Staphylococcus argensis]|uniref:DUF443 family protein n=1 Tax=Staphylococcus argensis TaxID=1607738 RepID=UPI0011AA4FE2